jgi:hypothetical protein
MAIAVEGSTLVFHAEDTDGSQAVTVPAAATAALIGVSGFHSSAGNFSTNAMTLGGQSSAGKIVAADGNSSVWQGALHLITLPATGSQTLAWDWVATAVDPEVKISVIFLSGVDTASPIRDSEGKQNGTTTQTSKTLTAQSGDFIVAWAAYFTGGSEGTSGWTNATTLADIRLFRRVFRCCVGPGEPDRESDRHSDGDGRGRNVPLHDGAESRWW